MLTFFKKRILVLMNNMLERKIENKKIVWFKNSNSYLVLEPIVAEIILKLKMEISLKEIEIWSFDKINAPKQAITEFVKDIYLLYKENNKLEKENESETKNYKTPNNYYSQRLYEINNLVFNIQTENAYLERLIHPVFAHLETKSKKKIHYSYQVFEEKNSIVFLKNNVLIGKWNKKEAHVFQGKISMHILIDCYKKPEKNWMGVFHASAVSNNKEAMLFLGDSGNGKSTSLAILNANGFNCIADDFVPIDDKKTIRTYPAAISIKKKSIEALLPFYPKLKNTEEHHLKKLNKIVRYLPPKNIDYDIKLKCKALVFIKYDSEVELDIKSISKIDAFQQLIPDSWISPIQKNASTFLDWFLELPCYQLTYFNNSKMIKTVSKIFNDDL